MGRKSNVFLTTVGCIGLASVMSVGTAFAGQLDAGNTKVAAEIIPAATGIPGPGAFLAWQSDSPLSPSTVVNVSLVNGEFVGIPANTIKICDTNLNVEVQDNSGTLNAGTTVGDTSFQLTLLQTVSTGLAYLITNAANCLPATTRDFTGVVIAAGTTAGNLVDVVIDVPTNAAGNATAPIFNIVNQFSAEVIPVDTTLDFFDFQEDFVPEGGPNPPSTPNSTTSRAGIIITSDESIPPANRVALTPNVGGCLDSFTAGDGITIEMTGDLAGLLSQDYGTNSDPFSATDKTDGMSTATPSDIEVLVCRSDDSLASAKSNNEKAVDFDLLSDGTGDGIPIVTGDRTIEVKLDPNGGDIGAGNTRTLITLGTTSHTIGLDATTFFIPLIVFDPAANSNTFTAVSSSSNIVGANGVTGNILTDDGSYANCSFGSITPGTPLSISGADWDSCVAADGKTVDLATGTSAKVTVNAPQNNVQGLTNQTFAGTLSQIPMSILDGNRTQ